MRKSLADLAFRLDFTTGNERDFPLETVTRTTRSRIRPGNDPRIFFSLVLSLLCCLAIISMPLEVRAEPEKVKGAERWGPFTPYVIDMDLRNVPPPVEWKPGDPIKEIPRKRVRPAVEPPAPEPALDPLLGLYSTKSAVAQPSFENPRIRMEGQGFSGVNPPDTVGDVGENYYIQAINGSAGTLYTVYDKESGSAEAGPFTLDELSDAGECTNGLGDPIVLYDHYAKRWILSEFSNFNNYLCVYISQTSDPIAGGWYNYQFQTTDFPDYPKYGVWPDAYYVTTNEDDPSVYALEKEKMLSGQPAGLQSFTVEPLSGFPFQALTPCDADGAAQPPSESPFYFARHVDDEAHFPAISNPNKDYLEIFEMDVDWNNSSNTTLTGPIRVAVSDFDSSLCGLSSYNCFRQPGSNTTLDPLREVIMHRLQYRNFGTRETLVGSFVTDVDGTDHGGVRWFELRKVSGGGWTLYQEGTQAPDEHSRWMSSIAMDKQGNIALGYNVSSATLYPGLRYAGRLSTDVLGVMPHGEYTLVSGTAANGSNRYGDYASMSVDPVNECEFWFTGMYNENENLTWSTYIASFQFDSCVCVPPAVPSGVTAATDGNNRIGVSWSAVAGADSYRIYRSGQSCESLSSFQLIAAGAIGVSYVDTDVSGGSTYYYRVSSFNGAQICESKKSDCAQAKAVGECRLLPTFDGVNSVVNQAKARCGLTLGWDAAVSECGTPLKYNIYRSTSSSFAPGSSTLIESCVTGTTYTDNDVFCGDPYYYTVLAEGEEPSGTGPCYGGALDANRRVKAARAYGPGIVLLADDMESSSGKWVAVEGPANPSGTTPWDLLADGNGYLSAGSWFCSDEARVKDQTLQTLLSIDLTGKATGSLSFWHLFKTESTFDGGVLEYSVNGGLDWFDILEGDGADIPANPNRFTQNGYSSAIKDVVNYYSPIKGRKAWSGQISDYRQVGVNLSDFLERDVMFRWRLACDISVEVEGGGWRIDNVRFTASDPCSVAYVSPETVLPCGGGSEDLKTAVGGGGEATTFLVAQGDYVGPVTIGPDAKVIIGYTPDFSSTAMTKPVAIVGTTK